MIFHPSFTSMFPLKQDQTYMYEHLMMFSGWIMCADNVHRIAETCMLQKTSKIIQSNLLMVIYLVNQTMTLNPMSNCVLDTFKVDDLSTSLGIPFQRLTTFSMQKFLLLSSLSLPRHSLRLCSLVLLVVAWQRADPHLASFQVDVKRARKLP